ncbi:MAG: LemA family protein [Candidatus Sumerlaeaceae bacterium]|nr:LemA family protein [Candidatus Sumerlaeaceae bacterium]
MMAEPFSTGTTVACLLVALLLGLCLGGAFLCARRKRLIDDTPTLTTRGVFIGLVELKGTAESEAPLHGWLSGQPCVWYAWSVEEHWERTVTETYTDSAGRSRTRTRTESGWKTVDSGGESQPFYLRDADGEILIRPDGAEIQPETTLLEDCGPEHPLYYGKGPAHAVADSTDRRRFKERAIPLHSNLYVFGYAREREDVVAPEIAQHRDAPLFLISTHTEQEVRLGYAACSVVLLLVGLTLLLGTLYFARGGRDEWRDWPTYAAFTAGYTGAVALVWAWMVYNSLVELRQRVGQAWSLIEVQLRRRADLIPNLVAAVKGYSMHEQAVQEAVALLRAQIAATPPGAPGDDPRGLAPVLAAVVERYPDLKADTSFLNLQHQLADTEERIALARGYFNDIATFYNRRLDLVPDILIARLFGFRRRPLMEAAGFERAPVAVTLADA